MTMQLLLSSLGSSDITRLDTATYNRVQLNSATTAGFRIQSDGKVFALSSGAGYTERYDWVIPNGSAANYECRWVTLGSDPDTTPGASGTWLALTSTRTWDTTCTLGQIETRSFTCELRKVGGATLFSVTITLIADGQP